MKNTNEKELDLKETLEKIQDSINQVYPFNILLRLNPDKPQNAFIVTITQKAFKKHGKDVLEEIFKYFKEEFKVSAELIYEKRKKPLFGKDMHIYYTNKIN